MSSIRTKTGKGLFTDLGLVTFGHGIGALLGFASLVVVSRFLPQTEFGLFAITVTLMSIVVSLTDFGISTSATHFASGCIEKNPGRAAAFLKAAFSIRLTASTIVMIAGIIFAAPLAEIFMDDPGYAGMLRLAFIGTLFMSIGAFGNAVFQSWRKFFHMAAYSIVSNSSRLLAILTMALLGVLGIKNGVAAYALAPLLGVIMVFSYAHSWLLKRSTPTEREGVYARLANFNKWLGVAFAFDVVANRVSILVLSNMRSGDEVAVFAAAMQMALVLPLVLYAFISVLLPRVSILKTRDELKQYTKRSLGMSALISVAFIPAVLFAEPLVEMIFGSSYAPSGPVLRIMLLGFILTFIVNPLYTVLYPLNRTRTVAVLSTFNLVGMVVVTLLMVPPLGAIGAAYSFLAVTSVWSLAVIFTISNIIKKAPVIDSALAAKTPLCNVVLQEDL